MNNLEQQTEQQINLIVTEEMRSDMYVTSKWTKFIAWTGFVFSGLLFLMAVIILFYGLTKPVQDYVSYIITIICIVVIYMLVSLVCFYLHLILLKYSISTRNAILYGHQNSLNDATKNLKSYFKIFGIIISVSLAFYIVFIILFIFDPFH